MIETAVRIANRIKEYDKVRIVSHIDADGIAAGSIASIALEREGIEQKVDFVKQLDNDFLNKLRDENPALVWLTDLGSGAINQLERLNYIITDHHTPRREDCEIPKKERTDLVKLFNALERDNKECHLNPHLFDRDGATDLSGAGATYLVAKALNAKNIDLSPLAVVGAVGDLQDAQHLKLIGTNREILKDGIRTNLLKFAFDLRYFGRETRPLFKLLQYANDPLIPGISGSEDGAISLLLELGVRLKDGEHWRRWIDLTLTEKRKIISELTAILISKGFGHEVAKRLIGEVYILEKEEAGTELHDAKEFATLLNSCGRYEKAEIGYKICLGDREDCFKRAQLLLQGHRKTLIDTIQMIKELGVKVIGNIQYFHGKDKVLDSVIGTVAGMMLGSGELNRNLPIIAFAESSENHKGIKVSARATRELVAKGLDLSHAIKKASEIVGGVGGGHNIAAGAHIPKGSEMQFLECLDKLIKEQLRHKI